MNLFHRHHWSETRRRFNPPPEGNALALLGPRAASVPEPAPVRLDGVDDRALRVGRALLALLAELDKP